METSSLTWHKAFGCNVVTWVNVSGYVRPEKRRYSELMSAAIALAFGEELHARGMPAPVHLAPARWGDREQNDG